MEKVKFGNSEYDLIELHNKEFYEVTSNTVNEEPRKLLRISGYIWKYEDRTWRYSYYAGAYIRIKNKPIEEEDVNAIEMESKMYEKQDLTEDMAASLARVMYDDEPIYPLPIEEVTLDTPDGCYINIKEKTND